MIRDNPNFDKVLTVLHLLPLLSRNKAVNVAVMLLTEEDMESDRISYIEDDCIIYFQLQLQLKE